ncbi:MAG: CheR family methyltransferase [Pseudomonadota bacterium]
MIAKYEKLLKHAMGLDADTVGPSAIARAIRVRMSACNLNDTQAYWERICASKSELQELVETVVVQETWFFRDREAFATMVRMVHQEFLPDRQRDRLRVLSLPCSTGEEPYSIAMTLLDAGVPEDRFCVDAVDISARAIAQAEGQVYGKNSFRGNDLEFRDRHFTKVPKGYRLASTVRAQVRFEQGNLFDAAFLRGVESYDIIFCRNLLIYFDSVAQDSAVGVLTRLLRAKGLLFVGPSETSLLVKHHFVPVKSPMAFAFRKVVAVGREPKRDIGRPIWNLPSARHATTPIFQSVSLSLPAPSALPKPRSPAETKPTIEEIWRIADCGNLVEAARCCEEYLRNNGQSPEAMYLMGLIRDAAGNQVEAADYYRKTLYLQPNHHEALAHLAFLLEKEGDLVGANILNDRARRLKRTGGA